MDLAGSYFYWEKQKKKKKEKKPQQTPTRVRSQPRLGTAVRILVCFVVFLVILYGALLSSGGRTVLRDTGSAEHPYKPGARL